MLPYNDKTLKTKRVKGSNLCNVQKRNDLVKFSWKVNRDIVVPGFEYRIREEKLTPPHKYVYVQAGLIKTKYWRDTVYLSEYLYFEIHRICRERWPSKPKLTKKDLELREWAKRQREEIGAEPEMAVYHDNG